MTTHIAIIAAMAKNRVIGIRNTLPWHLPADLKHFKALTMGHHILMGRKTYESIGKPLPGRTTVVITRNAGYAVPGCIVATSVEDAIKASMGDDEIFFVGGAELYGQALPLADRLYLTEIQSEYVGDAFFPEFDHKHWKEIQREKCRVDAPDGIEYHFVTYDRNR
jgi:dihydrofolate reductase